MEATNEGAANQNYLSLMANIGIIPYEEKGDIGNRKPDDLTKCKLVKKGDLVINSMNYAIGSYGMSDYDGVCSPVYVVLRTREDVVLRRFALRVFENTAFQKYVASLGNGILKHRAAIGWDDIKGINIPLPPKPVQQVILDFVDEATRKLDRLVALRRRQMDLLREQLAALIQQVVTLGLNPNTALKDSGISWLSRIPKHWEVKRLKYLTPQVTVGIVINPSAYYVETGVFCLRSLNVKPGKLITRDLVFISEDSHRLMSKSAIYQGDLVAVRTGQPGTAAVVDERFHNANCIDLIIIRRSARFVSEYLEHILNSGFAKSQFDSGSDGAIQQHFNIQTAKNLLVVLPPREEQKEILNFIRREKAKTDRLLSAYARQLDLLTEYRTALIHECVTGERTVGEPLSLRESS
jgi:type I restriction enzyme S subunit